jgi:CHASE2 domain-containing sensor protein
MTHTDTRIVRKILSFDALTCLAAGAAMAFGAELLSGPTGLHQLLLLVAGCSLFPVAGLFAWMARTPQLSRPLVMLAVIGNAGWVAASVAVLVLATPTAFGIIFVAAQALVVAILAWLELRHAPHGRDMVAA